MANGLPLHTEWFMQVGVTPHIGNSVLHLNTVFGLQVTTNCYPDRHSCGNFWPLVNPDLNPWDFFLWGFLKEVFPHKPFSELKMTGMLGLRNTCVAMLLQTCRHLQEVTRRNGDHIEHILTKSLHKCWAICMKFLVDKQPIHLFYKKFLCQLFVCHLVATYFWVNEHISACQSQ
jgi:hypothetical protein